jgi:hypothetical protein
MLLHAAAVVHFRWFSALSDQAERHSELKIEVAAREQQIVRLCNVWTGLNAIELLPEQATLSTKRPLAQHEAHVCFYALPTVFAVSSVSEHAASLIDSLRRGSSYHQWKQLNWQCQYENHLLPCTRHQWQNFDCFELFLYFVYLLYVRICTLEYVKLAYTLHLDRIVDWIYPIYHDSFF